MTSGDLVLTRKGVRFAGRLWPCTLGRAGVTPDKREGDGATPAGTHRIVGVLYRPDRMDRPVSWAVPILPGDLWCDAPDHRDYNQKVRAPFNASAESLRRADSLYDLILITDWNWPTAVAGRGSAIFLHRWRAPGRPTEGCIAFRPDHLLEITRRLAPTSRLIVSSSLA